MTVTPVYAALVALLLAFLSFRVIAARRRSKVPLGDGGDRRLMRRLRAQGNLAEYAPMVIVLMALAELQGAATLLLHVIGLCLIAGRLVHAYGVSQEPETYGLRVSGMALTFTALIMGALANLRLVATVAASS